MTSQLKWIGVVLAVLGLIALGVWFFFLRSEASLQNPSSIGLGVGDSRTVVIPATDTSGTDNGAISAVLQNTQKIFKIADGPVASAALVQTLNPTTTLARYVLQENGHVFDQVLDSSGAVPRAVSNTTIPGAVRDVWEGPGAVILQYMDAGVVKSVYLGFPAATTTATSTDLRPVQIRFLTDNIESLAASPDGKSIVYLLDTAQGADGYVAKSDGTGSKKLFSVPFSEILVSWPAQTTQLLWTKSATGVSGVAFSVNVARGDVVPLLYAPGLTVTADKSFSRMIYRVASEGGASSYVHDMSSGAEAALSFDPIPEKCIQSSVATSTLYCATPLQYVPGNYLDLWHQGLASVADSIIAYDIASGKNNIVASPGATDGGTPSDIVQMAVSVDDKYLVFIKKSDRSLWGVRLGQ